MSTKATSYDRLTLEELKGIVRSIDGLKPNNDVCATTLFAKWVDVMERKGDVCVAYIRLPNRIGGAQGWVSGTNSDPFIAGMVAYIKRQYYPCLADNKETTASN